jgi:hypothetical protein
VAAVPQLPRLGARGILVDLGALDSAAPSTGDAATSPEVWLGPRTPDDALDRLAAAGLQINRDRTYEQVLAELRGEGPAVSRHVQLFALFGMGALALLGALVSAAVDRRRRAGELRALRIQGVGRRAVSIAALTGYLGLALAAVLVGVASGVAVWHFGRLHIPVFTDGSDLVAVPAWPEPGPVAAAVGGIGALLVALLLTAAWDLRREVARGAGTRGARLRNRPAGVPD